MPNTRPATRAHAGAGAGCPHLHTPCPAGYLAWHEWAEEKSKTHLQVECPGCGLWAIWVPKELAEEEAGG